MPSGFGFTVPQNGGRRLSLRKDWVVTVQISGRQTAERFTLAEVSLAAGGAADEPLVHDACDVAVVVRSGRLRARLGSEHLTLGPGEVLYASRGQPHGFANPFEEPLVYSLVLSPSGPEVVWQEMAAHVADEGALPPAKVVHRWWAERGTRPAPVVVDPWERWD